MGEAINLVENFKVEKVLFNCGEFNKLKTKTYKNNINLYDIIFNIEVIYMKSKKIWIVLLIIGIISFIIPSAVGLYDSINGFSGICFVGCERDYGIKAFFGSIYLYSYIFWPTYIIGAILIVLSIIKLKNKKCSKL